MDECRLRIIDLRVSKRSKELVVVDIGDEDVLGINQTSGVVAEAETIRESLETLK